MKQGIWRLKKVMSICTLFVFASCDKKEGDVRAEILPEGPVVIDAKYEYQSPLDPEEKVTVSPPWFSFVLKAKNYNRDKRASIIAVTLKIKGTKNGAPTEAKAEFTGTSDSDEISFFDTNCDGSKNTNDKIGSLFELDPGVGCVSNVTLYAGSLPEDDDFKYNVEATFVGWYNRFDSGAFVPDERLEIKSAFSTR